MNCLFLINFSKLWLLTEKTAFFKDLMLLNKFALETAIAKSKVFSLAHQNLE